MHEMSIAESIVRLLQRQAHEQHFSRVKRIWLKIGPLATVELESLRFCFSAACRGTLAEGAGLEIVSPEPRARCGQCGLEQPVSSRFDACQGCGGFRLQLLQGDEMQVHELEVE